MSDQGSPGRGRDNSNIYESPVGSPSGSLRRPLAATQARLLNRAPDCNQNQNMDNTSKKSFTLSVDAPVFVPKSYPAPQSVQQEQTLADISDLSVSAPVFVPCSINLYNSSEEALYEDFNRLLTVRPAHLEDTSAAQENTDVVKTFKTMLFQLTTLPGNMDELIHPMGEMLRNGVTNEETVKQIINLLYEQGVTEANFRYTGAKVCKYLSKDMKGCSAFDNFRSLFLRRCKEDFNEKERLVSDAKTLPRICGLTMFIGELFLNMELEDSNGSTVKLGVLRTALLELMLTLLSNPSDATIKCVTQTIKLTGSTIQDTVNFQSSNEPGFDEVFARLIELEKYPDVGKTALLLIKSVLNLRECNWGRQDSSSSTPTTSMPPNLSIPPPDVPSQFLQDEPVFYNSLGQMISREEAGFFQEDDYQNYSLNDEEEAAYTQFEQESWNHQPYPPVQVYEPWSQSPEGSYGSRNNFGPDMDEEMEAAYEEFLRCQRNGYP